MGNLRQIDHAALDLNAFQAIGKDWMLITAEREGRANTMTASWGGIGHMWNKNVAFTVIRPQRYTKEFVDAVDTFSLSFIRGDRKVLSYLGTVSGRDEDKIGKSGLTLAHADGTPYFEEAHTVLICKKLFSQPYLEESFLYKELYETWYPEKDYHTLYISEVIQVLTTD